MPVKKQIIIVCMVFIVVAIGLIFVIGGRGGDSAEKRLAEAKSYYDMLDYDKAIAIYNNLLSTDTGCAEAYLGLADTYMVKGNSEKAMEILERGSLNSDDPRISEMLAELSAEYGNAEDVTTETSISDEQEEVIPAENETVTNVPDSVTDDTQPAETEPEQESVPSETTVTAVPENVVTEVPATTAPPVTETRPPQTTTRPPQTTTRPPQTTTRAPQTTTQAPKTTTTTAATVKPTIEVPNFIGMDKDEAVKLAKSLNIDVKTQFDKNDMYANDIVYYQSHRAGTLVSEKDRVEIYICVNDTKQVTEDDIKAQDFYNAVKVWGDANSDKVTKVVFNENNGNVSITVNSIKKLVIDENVSTAFAACKKASLSISAPTLSMYISSSSVKSGGKMDLSANTYGNATRVTLDMGASGSLNCTASVTLNDCEITSDAISEMKLYYNDKKQGSVSVNSSGKPVISVSNGGQYVIH